MGALGSHFYVGVERYHCAVKKEAPVAEVIFQLLGRHGFGVEESLRLVAAHLAQPLGLLLCFNAFGDNAHLHVMSQPDNRLGDRHIIVIIV